MAKRKCKTYKMTRAGRRCASYGDAARTKAQHIRAVEDRLNEARLSVKRCTGTSALPYAGCKEARTALQQALREIDQIEWHARQKAQRIKSLKKKR